MKQFVGILPKHPSGFACSMAMNDESISSTTNSTCSTVLRTSEMSRNSSQGPNDTVDVDEAVTTLDPYSLQVIDNAFDEALGWHPDERPAKRQRLTRSSVREAPIDQGGFLLDDDDDVDMEDVGGGGFIPEQQSSIPAEHSTASTDRPQNIPLSLIPNALEILGLPPDDDEIMEVFKNASSGWSGNRGDRSGDHSANVARRDWRAVCAALFPNGIPNPDPLNDSDDNSEDDFDAKGDESDDSEEYLPGGSGKRGGRTTAGKSKGKARLDSPLTSDESEDEVRSRRLSIRQKNDCRAAFALFFPDLASDSPELEKKRLNIKDMANAANSIKEKLSAEDVSARTLLTSDF